MASDDPSFYFTRLDVGDGGANENEHRPQNVNQSDLLNITNMATLLRMQHISGERRNLNAQTVEAVLRLTDEICANRILEEEEESDEGTSGSSSNTTSTAELSEQEIDDAIKIMAEVDAAAIERGQNIRSEGEKRQSFNAVRNSFTRESANSFTHGALEVLIGT